MDGQALLWPIAALGAGAVATYLTGRLWRRDSRLLAALTAAAYGVSLALLYGAANDIAPGALAGSADGRGAAFLVADPGGLLVGATGLVLGLAVAIYSGAYLALDQRYESYYPLLLLMSAGILGMLLAADLFVLYLFTMLSAVSAYVLVAFRRHTDSAVEAGFKYAVMGSLGSALILFGLGFVYRQNGHLQLVTLPEGGGPLVWLGPALIVAGLAVKGALVPAHTWLPDAHGRAPSSVSAMLSGVYVESNVYVMVRLGLALGWAQRGYGLLLVVLAVLNMVVGNTMALRQGYGKRLLAYSSVAQMGYMLLAFGLALATGSELLFATGLFLVVGHAWMKGLAFLAKGVCHFYCDATLVEDLDGIARRMPATAGLFAVALAGLAGVPPLAGFLGKWQLAVDALRAGNGRDGLLVAALMLVFLVNALVALGYYLPLIGRMWRRGTAGEVGQNVRVSRWMLAPAAALAGLIVLTGVWPGPVYVLAMRAAERLLGGG